MTRSRLLRRPPGCLRRDFPWSLVAAAFALAAFAVPLVMAAAQ